MKCELAWLCTLDAPHVVTATCAFEEFEMAPLRNDAHEGAISSLDLQSPCVVRHALQSVVVVVH